MSCYDCFYAEKRIKKSASGLPISTYVNCWYHSNSRYQGGPVPYPDKGCDDCVSEDAFFAKIDAQAERRIGRDEQV